MPGLSNVQLSKKFRLEYTKIPDFDRKRFKKFFFILKLSTSPLSRLLGQRETALPIKSVPN